MEKMLSASEIRKLGLLGVPKTKPGIAAMAKREGWRSETRTGLGGTRVVYEVPARYFAGNSPEPRDRYTAAEIASMRLPGLPTSKVNVIARAEKECWEYEEVSGQGGVRRLYTIPSHYLVDSPRPAPTPIAGTVVAGSAKVDLEKLELAMRALTEWESTRNVTISAERRPAVVAVLYDYLVQSEGEVTSAMEVVFRALA